MFPKKRKRRRKKQVVAIKIKDIFRKKGRET